MCVCVCVCVRARACVCVYDILCISYIYDINKYMVILKIFLIRHFLEAYKNTIKDRQQSINFSS